MTLRRVGRIQQNNALALVTGFGDQSFGFLIIPRPGKRFAPLFVGLLHITGVKREAGTPISLVTSNRTKVVPLIRHCENGLPHLNIVEWRL